MLRRTSFLLGLSVGLVALSAACSPYDPELGDTPFRCGTDEPRCPSGYQCVEYSPAEQICERAGGGDPEIDADPGNLDCNDDTSIEPNDTTATAWTTPIPASRPDISLVQLAICPDTDKDLFRFGVEVNDKNVRATVTTVVADGSLLLQVLNGAGAVIANGQATGADKIIVAVNNLAIGTYYIQVSAPVGVQNNYTLDIVTCSGPPCP